ncbi:MAG: hypothetical protein ACTSX6_04550 [Candidatus Heimdallarchaeaceae archaeon]
MQTRRRFITDSLKFLVGVIAFPPKVWTNNKKYINPEKFSLHEYPIDCSTYYHDGREEHQKWNEYFIYYGHPDNNWLENKYAFRDLFAHPVPGAENPNLKGKCDDGWEHTYPIIVDGQVRSKTRCVDGVQPKLVEYVRGRINPLIIIYYRTDGDAIIGFHPKHSKDKKFHLEQLTKLKAVRL